MAGSYRSLIALFLSSLLVTLPRIPRAEVQLLSETEQSLDLEVIFESWHRDSLQIEGETLQLFWSPGTDLVGEPGEPQIPVRTVLVAIPPGSRPRVTITQIEPEMTLDGVTVAPQPYVERSQSGAALNAVYRMKPAVYHRSEWYPRSWLASMDRGRVRDNEVLRIRVAGLRFSPSRRAVELLRSIGLRVHFDGAEETPNQTERAGAVDPFLARLVVNPGQAAKWQLKRTRQSLRKRVGVEQQTPWYKLIVRKEGIYKLDGKTLQKAGIDLASIDVASLRIYNNGGRELPRSLSAPRPDSLIENAILVEDGGDGRFDPDDYILFYGRGVDGWEYDPGTKEWRHYINHYTYDNVYWLTWGKTPTAKRMQRVRSVPLGNRPIQTTYRDRIFLEEEIVNPLHSGLEWLGREFVQTPPTGRSRDFSLDLSGAIPEDSTTVRVQVAAYVTAQHQFSVSLNGNLLGQVSFTASSGEFSLGVERRLIEATRTGLVRDGINTLTISYSSSSDVGSGYLDWYEVEYTRRLEARNDELRFTLPASPEGIAARVRGFSSQTVRLFDISRFWDVREITGVSWEGNSFVFVDTTTAPPEGKTYLALTPDRYLAVEKIEKDQPSNLRSPRDKVDLIIITHEDFETQAMQLRSLHENWLDERLETEVVLITDVFDEFSWGLFDPTAIRDFLHYAYEHWGQPRFVLLFGDGDYDYKNLEATDQNWIPPYETTEKDEEYNRTTDDWFVCVAGDDNFPDMAIGRIPVRTPEEAQNAVDKLIKYTTEPTFGPWKNTLTMVADDELVERGEGNEIIHTVDGENIAEKYFPSNFHVEKIYLMEYPAVRTAAYSGVAKPKATEALLERINRGTLVLNFIGHGAPRLWTHERLLLASRDLEKIQNDGRLPLWIAATCDFGRFDHPKEQSLSEDLMVAKDRGAVAVISSTRLGFASLNASFNRRLLQHLFEPHAATGRLAPLGEAMVAAKLTSGNTVNDEKYNLLGDPALRLAAPRLQVQIDEFQPDSIRALSLMTVRGTVKTRTGEIVDRPDGRVLVTVYDSKKLRKYRTAAGSVVQYYLPGNPVYRGVVRIHGGRFQASFIVPKDITYGGTLGRIEAYYWDATRDGNGSTDGIPVGGTSTSLADGEGPVIRAFRGEQELLPGDPVPIGETIRIEITDSLSGINLTGDIGHKITLTIDDDPATLQDLTERFQYFEGSYVAGALEYQLENLEPGEHAFAIKAWDNSNNSSTLRFVLKIVEGEKLAFHEVLNYPNPFSERTDFTFYLTRDAWVTVRVFTLAGRLIYESEPWYCSSGFNWIPWDGRDSDGDAIANGLYLYQLTAIDGKGARADALGKLVVAR